MKRLLQLTLVLTLALTLCAPVFAADDGQILLTLRTAQKLTDQQLQGISAMLAVLGTTGEVQSLDWETMAPLLGTLRDNLPSSTVWYAEPDGTYYAVDQGLSEQSLADREYFPALLDGEPVIGAVVVSKSSGKLSAIVAAPILREGEVVGALGVSVYMDGLADYLQNCLGWPNDLRVKIVDANDQELAILGFEGKNEGQPGLSLQSEVTGWTYLPLVGE